MSRGATPSPQAAACQQWLKGARSIFFPFPSLNGLPRMINRGNWVELYLMCTLN